MATFKASKFRSPHTAAVLREEAEEHEDFLLSRWTESAIEDLTKFVHLRNSANKTAKRTWYAARKAVQEGVELFASTFYPDCADVAMRRRSPRRHVYYDFVTVRLRDIEDMAALAEENESRRTGPTPTQRG